MKNYLISFAHPYVNEIKFTIVNRHAFFTANEPIPTTLACYDI